MLTKAKETYTFGCTTFSFAKETVVMGILNVTPDSFSDGGRYNEIEAAVAHAKEMIQQGAKIIDVGGESTRPGHAPVSEAEEIERVIPIVRALKEQLNCVISVDTYKAEVAKQAIEAGASIINDVWGAKREPRIAEVAKAYDVPIILMHNRVDPTYGDRFDEVYFEDLKESIAIAKEAGVADENIWLDPGVGFAKTQEQNIRAMQLMPELATWGYPILLGTSRKSLIGYVLDVPVEERLEGSLATVSYGVMNGAHIVRVHDVLETVRTTKMMDVLTK